MYECKSENCDYFKLYGECSSACVERGFKKTITNFDRIKAMSVEEMAKEFVRARMQLDEDGFDYDITYSTSDRQVFINYQEALKHQKQWLESEVKGG